MDAYELLDNATWGAMVFMGTGLKSGMSTLYFVAAPEGIALFKKNGDSLLAGTWDSIVGFEAKGKNLIIHFAPSANGTARNIDIRSTSETFREKPELPILSPAEAHEQLTSLWKQKLKQDHGGPISEFDENPMSVKAVWLGGHGQPAWITQNSVVELAFRSDALAINEDLLPWSDLLEVTVGGPGAYQTGGGWVGGGFGAAGIVEGVLLGAVLNKLTTKKHVESQIRFIFERAELNFVTNQGLPEEIELFFSPLRAYIRTSKQNKPASSGESTFCSECGTKAEGGKFCGSCGNALR